MLEPIRFEADAQSRLAGHEDEGLVVGRPGKLTRSLRRQALPCASSSPSTHQAWHSARRCYRLPVARPSDVLKRTDRSTLLRQVGWAFICQPRSLSDRHTDAAGLIHIRPETDPRSHACAFRKGSRPVSSLVVQISRSCLRSRRKTSWISRLRFRSRSLSLSNDDKAADIPKDPALASCTSCLSSSVFPAMMTCY